VTLVGTGWAAALAGDVRANAAYRLRRLDSLPERYRRSLEAVGVDTEAVVGILVAHLDSGLPGKVVDAAAADLFASLERPGRPPAAFVDRLPELVLDGVLEVEGPTGFVSGPLAYQALHPDPGARIAQDRLGRLSQAGLEYAERLRLPSPDGLTARLYAYDRIPFSSRWRRAYPDRAAVLGLLPRRAMARRWLGPSTGDGSHWLFWSWRDAPPGEPPAAFPYKLYVSPRTEELPDALPAVVEALTASGAPRFKVGADARGLVRPDKIVVYLRDVHETNTVAGALGAALAGVAAHGVPFSAELAGGGVLSWGGDPPREAAPIGRRSESWRLSVCRRLAEGLVAAQRAPLSDARPLDFALARLAVDGVDIRSFSPAGLEAPAHPSREAVRA
jgi:HopA1 effector protein family